MEEIGVKEIYQEGYRDKMKNRLYGLLREREKDGEWEKFLDSILIELLGYKEELKTIPNIKNVGSVDVAFLID